MTHPPQIEQITERVERLLARHQALQHEHLLLQQQVRQLTSERDSLQSRLRAARARIDDLIDRLPGGAPHPDDAAQARPSIALKADS